MRKDFVKRFGGSSQIDIGKLIVNLTDRAESVSFGDSDQTLRQRLQIIRLGSASNEAISFRENPSEDAAIAYANAVSYAARTQHHLSRLVTLVATSHTLPDGCADAEIMDCYSGLRESLSGWCGAHNPATSSDESLKAMHTANAIVNAIKQSINSQLPQRVSTPA